MGLYGCRRLVLVLIFFFLSNPDPGFLVFCLLFFMCSRTRRKVREKLSRVTEGSEEVRNGKEFHCIIVPFFQLILAANLLMLAFNDVCSTRCCVLVSYLCQPLLPMLADGSGASTRTRSAARYTIVTSILHKCFQYLLC